MWAILLEAFEVEGAVAEGVAVASKVTQAANKARDGVLKPFKGMKKLNPKNIKNKLSKLSNRQLKQWEKALNELEKENKKQEGKKPKKVIVGSSWISAMTYTPSPAKKVGKISIEVLATGKRYDYPVPVRESVFEKMAVGSHAGTKFWKYYLRKVGNGKGRVTANLEQRTVKRFTKKVKTAKKRR